MMKIKNCALDWTVDAIVLADLDDNVIYINKAFLKLWGWDNEDEVIGKPFTTLWKDRVEVSGLLKRLRSEKERVYELKSLRKDGTTFEARVSASMVKNETGTPIGIMASIMDITWQKKLENIQSSIYRISEKAASVQKLDDLYEPIHDVVSGLMPAENFFIGLYDEVTGMIHFPYSVDEKDHDKSSIKRGKTLTSRVIDKGEPLLISHEEFKELVKKSELEQVGTPSKYWLGVPLKATDRIIGVLAVQIYEEGRVYTEEDKDMLVFVSTQIAMAIERTREKERKESLLKEKEMLLKEIHHRVKNNFNFINSLLEIQGRQVKNDLLEEQFQFAQDRIRSMALVHEKLCQSENLSEIDFTRYVKELTGFLLRAHFTEHKDISLKLNTQKIAIDIDKAIPCGLIINELFTNSLKYAFPWKTKKTTGQKNEIVVEFYPRDENTIVLRVKDNGAGLPEDVDFFESPTLGLRLVRLLSKQIHGTIELGQNSGTDVTITFNI
jgi:PAS domain S-box-containing protein